MFPGYENVPLFYYGTAISGGVASIATGILLAKLSGPRVRMAGMDCTPRNPEGFQDDIPSRSVAENLRSVI